MRKALPYLFLAALALAAGAILFGVEPATLAALLHAAPAGLTLASLPPIGLARRVDIKSAQDVMNMDVHDIKALMLEAVDDFAASRKANDEKLARMEAVIDEIALKGARPAGMGSAPGSRAAVEPAETKALGAAIRALVAGDQVKADRAFSEVKGMSVGTDPAGGYMVHPVLSDGMTKVMAEISPVYRLARKVPLPTGDAFEEPIDRDTAAAAWTGELSARAETASPALGLLRVELEEIYAMPKVSQKLIDTAGFDPVAWLTTKVGESFAVKEGAAFHDGTGAGQPRGFLSYPTVTTGDATRAWGQLQHISTGASGAFPTSSTTVNPADVLVDVITSMKAQYRNGAVWLMNAATAGAVRKLKDAEGRHVWVDSLIQGQPPLLLGYPVELDESMPDIGAGSLSIAFANLQRAYIIVEQPGIKFLTDPYSDKPNVLLYCYRRVGGGLANSEAIKLLRFA